jgi:hypothetical protein
MDKMKIVTPDDPEFEKLKDSGNLVSGADLDEEENVVDLVDKADEDKVQ